MRTLILFTCALLMCAAETGGLSGSVSDSSGTVLSGAEVLVQSEATGARWKTVTDEQGRYLVPALAPGRYKATVRLAGFRTVSRVGAVLDSSEGLRIDFSMELLQLHETITVVSGEDTMDPSGASSLLVTRGAPGATLPANGGDYRVLFDLMPGVVITPAGSGDAGQFASNGQRPNSNSFRVDGVSANTGVGSSTLPGAFPGASLPAMTAIGTTENLVSNETAQTIELRTSDFAPGFGERPGAEALVTTRSGSNRFHAAFYERLRENDWNARDWFANSRGLDFVRPYYRSLGLVAGGHIGKRTFFFFSAEEADLTDSGLQLTSVPSLATRLNAPDALKPILNYYPPPSGPDIGNGEALGLASSNTTARLLSTSLRIDRPLGKWGNFFFRFVDSPSTSSADKYYWMSHTFGLTAGKSESGIHDIRFNYSRANLQSFFGGGPGFIDAAFGVAGLLPGFTVEANGLVEFLGSTASLTSLLPQVDSSQTILGLSVPGLGQFVSFGLGKARQDQWEFRDTYSRMMGRHDLRAGIDYVRLEPSRDQATYAVLGVASSLDSLLRGDPLAVTVSSPAKYGGKIHAVSLFAQDTFRVSDRLNLIYGLRWEITPPTISQLGIPTVSGLWTGTDWQTVRTGVENGTAPWPMRCGQIAPRIGLAYRLPGSGVVVRGGAGIFYDATMGASVNPINGAPFNSWLLSAGGTGIDASGGSGGAGMGPTDGSAAPDVQRFLAGVYPALRLPTSYQWRVSVEKGIGASGVLSSAYLGSVGRNLLGHEAYVDPATGILERQVTLSANSSNYQALHMRYTGMVAANTYLSGSYTWAHSIDDGSQDSSVFLVHPGYRLSEARGSSSFDVRHEVTAALSYRIPHVVSSFRMPPWLANWTLSATLRVRSGFPIDIADTEQALGQGFDNVGRPNQVTGVPVWIADPTVAGGRRLNPAAFSVPAAGTPGTLGRNAIGGNGLGQLDMSLRREFPLFRGVTADVGLNVFNVLNHPAFADPVPYLSSPWFGQSTSMQNLMLGSGTPNTGLPPLFQTGGSRSAEFSFRISF
jgi:hypothetical protein